MKPLATVATPTPSGSDVVDQAAAVRLGKAFFWDVQTGGDGQIACATCHYSAGADTRRFNSVNPGPSGVFAADGVTGANQMATLMLIANDNRLGSQGIVHSKFVGVSSDPTVAADMCTPDPTPIFMSARSVTGRNAPSVVGAAYFRDNFWDGRANHVFNGMNPFGQTANGSGPMSYDNSSLASQAVGPANNEVEMSCAGRPFNGPNSLGTKLLARSPLGLQQVSPTDSVLGDYSAAPDNGLLCNGAPCSYRDMVAAAFGPDLAADAENQFSRIWGQAVAAYESTLLPTQTPLDRYLGGQKTALTANQEKGFGVFTGKGRCTHCHAGSELSDATVSFAMKNGLLNQDGGDQGFHNLGVRPTSEDLGRASLGPNNVSFSVSGSMFDRGAFKTPSLRNVKLTAPYFHNGGKPTLADVVDFYSRGGDFANAEQSKEIKPRGFDATEKSQLVDFLTNALTDCRTEMQRAPFDHPSLAVPNGPALPAVGAEGVGPCP